MITFTSSIANKRKPLKRSYFICPRCLDTCYVFCTQCTCGADIKKAVDVIKLGICGRLNYHTTGWYEMDRLSKERLEELKKIKEEDDRLYKCAGFI